MSTYDTLPTTAPTTRLAAHRRSRSRGGHSRSESLAESLADIVDVLQTIDEVPVDLPGVPTSIVLETAQDNTLATVEEQSTTLPAADVGLPPLPTRANRHRRGQSLPAVSMASSTAAGGGAAAVITSTACSARSPRSLGR